MDSGNKAVLKAVAVGAKLIIASAENVESFMINLAGKDWRLLEVPMAIL